MSMKVIDVSVHQGKIDWNLVKGTVDGVILRCGYGSDIASQDDKQWRRNADECTRLGIPFGVYLYSYAKNAEMAKSEAQHILRLIKGYKLSFPVYIDLEQSGCEKVAVIVGKTVGQIIESAGYWFGVYANEFWFNRYIKTELDKYTKWIAKYSSNKPSITGNGYDMWQNTSTGVVKGIKGNVDVSICYRDFPSEITGVRKTVNVNKPQTNANDQLFEEGHRNGKQLITTAAVNIRNDAGTQNTVSFAVLPKGTCVNWYGYYKMVGKVRWYYVTDGKKLTGYICGDYLK